MSEERGMKFHSVIPVDAGLVVLGGEDGPEIQPLIALANQLGARLGTDVGFGIARIPDLSTDFGHTVWRVDFQEPRP